MEKELNQVQTDDFNLFDDLVNEENVTENVNDANGSDDKKDVTENNGNLDVTPNKEAEAVQEVDPAVFLEVKYNKETKNLTREEAIELSQKGLNYDKVNEKFNALNSRLEKLASMNGRTMNEFLDDLDNAQINYEESKELERLKEQFPNSDETALKEIATSRVKERLAFKVSQYEKAQNEQINAQEEMAKREIEQFREEFPDVDMNKLPEEVYNDIDKGFGLISAYYKYLHKMDAIRISEAENKAKIVAQNEENKKRSLGNTTNVGGAESDNFLEGFNRQF